MFRGRVKFPTGGEGFAEEIDSDCSHEPASWQQQTRFESLADSTVWMKETYKAHFPATG